MHSLYKEGKSVTAERFIRTLKNNINRYMTSVPKNIYIDNLDGIVNKYDNIYHSTVTIKHVDIK